MSIEISISKSPKDIDNTKACQVFTERGGSIGRGVDNTWVLHDPERYISTVHSKIEYENGHYYLSDTSTNGTFLNGAAEPIGNGNRALLKNGDKFMLGDYEFTVNLPDDSFAGGDDPFGEGDYVFHSSGYDSDAVTFPDKYAHNDDPFASRSFAEPVNESPIIASDYEETDPIAALDKAGQLQRENPFMSSYNEMSQADNADAMQQSVIWPNVIPDDWDNEEMPFEQLHENVGPVVHEGRRTDVGSPDEAILIEQLHSAEQHREALAQENEQLLSDIIRLKQKIKDLENQQAARRQGASVSRFDGSLIDAMGLGGKKLSEKKKAEISAIVGLLMRESIAGLMQALSFRKKIKEEFRINVTTIQPIENNPLKFSANIEDAIENMFLKDNKAYMHPHDAVREGFQGISEHQVAVLAGIQAAFRGMIERLDPEALEKRFEKYRKTGVIKVGQKSKNWESYKEFHSDMVNNMDNSFQYYFGYDFVQAYEEQLQRLVALRKSKANKSN